LASFSRRRTGTRKHGNAFCTVKEGFGPPWVGGPARSDAKEEELST
jgi:hypothetical protein